MGKRWVSALLVAGACAVGLLWTWLIAFATDAGVEADQRLYVKIAAGRTAEAVGLAWDAKRLGDPGVFIVLVVCVMAVPLLRRRWVLAAVVAALIVGANLSTQVLQELTLGHRHVLLLPRAQWPSGHTTAVVSAALGLLLGAPPGLRWPIAVLTVAVALAVGWAVILLGSHLPSDVAGAVFVCGIWASLAVAALQWRRTGSRAAVA